MINKLYESIKKYIKENYKFLIILVMLLIVLSCPVPYFIYNGGGTIDISDRINVKDSNKKQNFYMCYVSQLRANIMTLVMSYIFPNIDNEKIEDDNYNEEEDKIINDILLKESQSNSIITAFNEANEDISINGEELYVTYIYDEAQTDLKVGDEILSIEDANIVGFDEFRKYISEVKIGEEITLQVKDIKGKKKNRKAKIVEIEDEGKIGVGISVNYKYKINNDINIKFKGNESGPSGGFMMSLAIYDKLTDSNLSENNRICGTGTITKDGEIGEIGGVKYKLSGAVKNKCDVFLVPSGDNYKDAVKYAKKYDYDIDIYEAKSFSDTVSYLKSIA